MTVLCGGGSSQPRTGVQTTITLTSIAIEAFVTSLGMPEIAPIVAAIVSAALTIDTAAYCATDPPADPGLTAADVADALNTFEPAISLPAQAKIVQWFEHRYWWQVCQCTTGTTPAPPAPTNPGPVSTNSGLPGGTNAPCFTGTTTDTLPGFTGPGARFHDLGPALLPPGAAITSSNFVMGATTGLTSQAYAIPANVTSFTFHPSSIVRDATAAASSLQIATLNFFDASGNWFSGLNLYQNTGATNAGGTLIRPTSGVWPSAATHWGIISGSFLAAGVTIGTQTLTIDSSVACTGFALETQCCPPDPTIENKLNQIIGLVNAIYSGLPVPLRSVAESTHHAGLTGSGSFAAGVNTLGVKVNVTTIPGYIGIETIDPTQYFELGWFTTSTAEGNYKSSRIEKVPELFLFDPLVDTLHYSLNPGVTADIVELIRGP